MAPPARSGKSEWRNTVFVAARHEFASLDVAQEAAKEVIPSQLDSAGRRRRLGMCTPTGRFCPCLTFFDPFCEGHSSRLSAYGSGISSYFKAVKTLAVTMALLTVSQSCCRQREGMGAGELCDSGCAS